MWTKRQIVEKAFEELALAGYVFDLQPEELDSALVRLDTVMATWSARGINLGYVFGATPDDTDLDDDSGLPVIAIEAAYTALARNIAASKGKQLPASMLISLNSSYKAMLSAVASANVKQQQLPATMPLGAGTKPWRSITRPFVSIPQTGPLQIGPDGGLELGD